MNFSPRKFKYLIIDSQLEDVTLLQQQIKKYQDYVCVGVARSKGEAINLIIDHLPQLVFFSVDLGLDNCKESSFSIIHELHQYVNVLPTFIAMSDSTEYSYQSIKNGVFDYLLKPLDYFDLKKMLMRYEKNQPESSLICLKSFTEFRFLKVEDIIYLKADNNTTDFYLKDGSMVTSYKTLKTFEDELPNIFARIHKSYMVNISYINKIHFSKFHCSLKHTSNLIPFSKSLKSRMLEIKDRWIHQTFTNIPFQIKIA